MGLGIILFTRCSFMVSYLIWRATMNKDYVITNDELAEMGLNLNDYVLNGTYINAIIYLGLRICITRCCTLNDNFTKGGKSVEEQLDKNPDLVETFKVLQYRVIYNLVFTANDNPVDQYVDDLIVFELNWGKINGFQKGYQYKLD